MPSSTSVLVSAWVTSDSTRPHQPRTGLGCGSRWLFRLAGRDDLARLQALRFVVLGHTRLQVDVDLSFREVAAATGGIEGPCPEWVRRALGYPSPTRSTCLDEGAPALHARLAVPRAEFHDSDPLTDALLTHHIPGRR